MYTNDKTSTWSILFCPELWVRLFIIGIVGYGLYNIFGPYIVPSWFEPEHIRQPAATIIEQTVTNTSDDLSDGSSDYQPQAEVKSKIQDLPDKELLADDQFVETKMEQYEDRIDELENQSDSKIDEALDQAIDRQIDAASDRMVDSIIDRAEDAALNAQINDWESRGQSY